MKKRAALLSAVLFLEACSSQYPTAKCADVASFAPSLDKRWVADLSARLAGPDRENTIVEAVATLRRDHPELDATMVEDVLIAADCPVATRLGLSEDGAQSRIAQLRGQVDQIMAR